MECNRSSAPIPAPQKRDSPQCRRASLVNGDRVLGRLRLGLRLRHGPRARQTGAARPSVVRPGADEGEAMEAVVAAADLVGVGVWVGVGVELGVGLG